jgi:hypothetical protein
MPQLRWWKKNGKWSQGGQWSWLDNEPEQEVHTVAGGGEGGGTVAQNTVTQFSTMASQLFQSLGEAQQQSTANTVNQMLAALSGQQTQTTQQMTAMMGSLMTSLQTTAGEQSAHLVQMVIREMRPPPPTRPPPQHPHAHAGGVTPRAPAPWRANQPPAPVEAHPPGKGNGKGVKGPDDPVLRDKTD